MADKKISALTAATTLDKTETFPIVQGGTTKKATIAQALAPLTILQSDAGTMLAGVPAYPVDGQVYLLTSLGITGVDHIRTVGIVDANTADFVFNNNCEAYLNRLGVYVPCTYDVATNNLQGEYVLWCADLSQTGSDAPFVSFLRQNISGETPTLSYNSVGDYDITFTGGQLISYNSADKFNGVITGDPIVFFCEATSSNVFNIKVQKASSGFDDGLNKTTIKIIIQLKSV